MVFDVVTPTAWERLVEIGDAMVCADVTKKLAKPYLYPTKASARGAQMRDAGEEVLTRLKPGNPPRRISWSVQAVPEWIVRAKDTDEGAWARAFIAWINASP